MNWTGGGLSRHSRNAKGATTGKQKEHFAKLRSGQQGSASQTSPIKGSVFNQIARANRSPDEQELPRRNRRAHGAREADHSASHRIAREPSLLGRGRRKPRMPSEELPVGVASSARANSPDIAQIRRIKEESIHETFGASLRSIQLPKRQRDTGSSQAGEKLNSASLMAKRRKILSQGDWVGMSFQKAPDLKYASDQKNDQIGRRRKISEGHVARYEHRRRELPPIARKQAPQQDHLAAKARNADVRISIGGRELRVGGSSSSAFGKAPTEPLHRSSGTASSDVMLLDCDGADKQDPPPKSKQLQSKDPTTGADTNVFYHQSPSNMSFIKHRQIPHEIGDSHAGIRETRPALSSNNGYISGRTRNRNALSNRSARTPTTDEIRDVYHAFRDQPDSPRDFGASLAARGDSALSALPGIPRQQLRGDFDEMFNASDLDARAVSSDRFTLLSFGEGGRITIQTHEDPTHVAPRIPAIEPENFICRSPPLMQHPAPQSSRTSQLLRSDVSDAGASMAVQTGHDKRATNEINSVDEEVWRSWILPDGDPLNQTQAPESLSLTPGISTYDVGLKKVLRSSSASQELPNGPAEQQRPLDLDVNHPGNTENHDESAVQLHSELHSCLYPRNTYSRSSSKQQQDLTESSVHPAPSKVPGAEKPQTGVDENSVWQKFVFTSDSEGEDCLTEVQKNSRNWISTSRERAEDSSLLVHPSSETDQPPEGQVAASRARPLGSGHKSFAEQQRTARELSAPEQELDGNISMGASQGAQAQFSISSTETLQPEPDDRRTTRATQGSISYCSSSGVPRSSGSSSQNTGLRSGAEQHSSSAQKQKFILRQPKPFIGRKLVGSSLSEESLRIGGTGGREGKMRERDIYGPLSEDKAESIKDD